MESISEVIVVGEFSPETSFQQHPKLKLKHCCGPPSNHTPLFPHAWPTLITTLYPSFKDPQRDLFFINFRNPFLTEKSLRSAIDMYYAHARRTLISIIEVKDNPCQYSRQARHLSSGMVHFFDSTWPSTVDPALEKFYRITKPFIMDWSKYKGCDVSGNSMFIANCGVDGYSFTVPVPFVMEPVVWQMKTPTQARLMVRRNLIEGLEDEGCKGFCHRLVHNQKKNNLLFESGEGRFKFPLKHYPGASQISILVEPYSVESGSPIPQQLQALSSLDLAKRECVINVPVSDGFVYTLFCQIETGPYDVRLPFQPTIPLWRFDDSGYAINIHTRKRILGRQDFIRMHERDGSFIIMSGASLPMYLEELFNGQIVGTVVSDGVIEVHSDNTMAWATYQYEKMNC